MDAPSKLLTSSTFGTMSTNGTLAVEYKMSACSKAQLDPEYQCSQVHSITSTGSSNHTELLRAYEFGKRLRESITASGSKNASAAINRQTLLVQTHNSEGQTYYEPSNVTTVTEDEDVTDPPTDPGIRRFTKSPPKPNEQRIGGCYNRLYRVTDSLDHKLKSSHNRHSRNRSRNRKKQPQELPELTDDSTDDGIIGNYEDGEEGGKGDEDDSDQSILTASPALSEEARSNVSDESSLVTPTNDLEDEDVDDDEEEDDEDGEGEDCEVDGDRDEDEEDELADENDTNDDTVDGINDPPSDGHVRKRSTFEPVVESSTSTEVIDHRSMNRRSNSHWSVRPNVSYITSEAIAIKSSVQLSHSTSGVGNGQSSFHSKNNDRNSHNRVDGRHSRGHKNLTSSLVTPSSTTTRTDDESGITSGRTKVHSVQSSSSRTSFDRQMHTPGVNSQVVTTNNSSPSFAIQPRKYFPL